MELRYNTQMQNYRYNYISEIGYMPNYQFKVTDEPFDMGTAMYFRWDKNIEAWVEGTIDEETGEWQLKQNE